MENNDDVSAASPAFEPIDDDQRTGVWETPIPVERGQAAPMVWLLGAHGGAGVSTLCHQLSVAGDCRRRWPSGRFVDTESPLVLLVGTESRVGLDSLARRVREHFAGQASRAQLVGVVTVGTARGRRPRELEHHVRNLSAAPIGMWHIPYVENYRLHLPSELPQWTPGATLDRPRRFDATTVLLPEIEQLGTDLIEHVRSMSL